MKGDTDRLHWWQTRWFVALMVLVSIIPLLKPDIPPLVDLPGHMGRYRVQLDVGSYPWLSDWYDFKWSLIGNLGVDLLVVPMTPIFGLELSVMCGCAQSSSCRSPAPCGCATPLAGACSACSPFRLS
jgi:hypothetical protein